jgi:hypothetical protein
MKIAIDWNAFPPLLEDLYCINIDKEDTEHSHSNYGKGALPSIHIKHQ